MAERTILVCDVCGQPAVKTVKLTVDDRTLKDLCHLHLRELVEGARKPRRGRKPGFAKPVRKGASAVSGRPQKSSKA
jgi:hypothetical protein